MNAVRNYQKELDRIIESIDVGEESAPTLFLHSCCAPCSSYVLEYLRKYFRITVFYYNPNISMEEEYRRRVAEQQRLIAAYNENAFVKDGRMQKTEPQGIRMQTEMQEQDEKRRGYHIEIIEGEYNPDCFYKISKGLEQCPEGGERCFACYELRLRETAVHAKAGKYDYFATTLSISPLKNAAKLNEIGERLGAEYGVRWLTSDFKKKGGYQRSVELSREYDLYRQDYCGCIYSKREV